MTEKKRELRKTQRYFYVTPLEYRGDGKFENLDALSINLSEDGIYFQANHHLPVGHKFILKFKIPGNPEILEAKCEVVHHSVTPDKKIFSIGCKITEVDGLKKEELRQRLLLAFGEDPDRIY